jgi:tartrate-resistant acid phosphatase type 5
VQTENRRSRGSAARLPRQLIALSIVVILLALAIPGPPTVARPGDATNPSSVFMPLVLKPTLAILGNSTRFAVIGDYGMANAAELAVANLVKSWNPDFIITVGDNNYPNGASSMIDENVGQYFHEFIAPYVGTYGPGAETNRFFPSLGNHDWDARGARPYLQYFSLPGNERYYDFVIGMLHFFALDSDRSEPDGATSDSIQGQWLQRQIAASNACWQLVFFHHPAFSSGAHHGSSVWMQWPFAAWGADVVLTGHDHTYERIVVDGLPYFVNGLGGGPITNFTSPLPGSQIRYNGNFGAMLVTATSTTISYQFIAVDGTIVDTYTQTGGCAVLKHDQRMRGLAAGLLRRQRFPAVRS